MFNYIAKIFILSSFAILNIYFYYLFFPGHSENFNGYPFFIGLFSIIFFIYKIIQWFYTREQKEVVFTLIKIVSYFLLFLFIICASYFGLNSVKNTFLLFGRIIYFGIFPITLFLLSTGFGEKIVNYFPNNQNFSGNVRFLLSLNIGFFSFIFILTIFSFFGLYNLFIVFGILLFFLIFSFKEIVSLLKKLFSKKIIFNKKEGSGIKLLITEIFYLIAFFAFSVGLITIIRPFPVGWDDLGVYMNFPNILSYTSGLSSFGEMYSWQIFTGIGYLLGEPVFAFYLNFSGYFLTFLTLNLIFSEVFKTEKKSFLFLPAILSTIFLVLPMSIFHSIKDIKIEQGLFFISTFIVFFTYNYLQKRFEGKKISFIYVFIIGLLVGFTFSIKFTSLFLIIGILSVLSFYHIGLFGLFGFLCLLFSFFSVGNLWQMMNVSISIDFIFSIISGIIGIFLITFGIWKKKNFKLYFKEIIIFFLGIFISLTPWFTKNIIEIYPRISIDGILKGKKEIPIFDLNKVFSSEELSNKEFLKSERKKREILTTNEDLKRYLGYENGILPFSNIFWNLSMQKNQGGKFTEISFLFLVFLPLIFIFLPFFRKNISLLFIFFVLFELFLFLKPTFEIEKDFPFKNISNESIENIFTKNKGGNYILNYDDFYKFKKKIENIPTIEQKELEKIWLENRSFSQIFRDFLASIELPLGYIIIFIFFIIPFLVLNYFLKNGKETLLFRLNLVFATVYIFFWSITSFGVVWYGIVMYFSLLLFIGYGGTYLSFYNKSDKEERFFGSLIFVLVILTFIFFSSLPYLVSNLRGVAYLDYKLWNKSYSSQSFDLHANYEKIFFELNIDERKREKFLKEKIDKDVFEEEFIDLNISQIINYLKIEAKNGNVKAEKSLEKIYEGILYPDGKFENKEKIYRIGTFLKYYIYKNQNRVFEDGLIYYFDDYIYDNNPEKTWENFKKLGVKYFILDPGSATIDYSEDHLLTKRYERLLSSLKAKNIEMLFTNSICMRFAKDLGDNEKFFKISSISYDSYDEDNNKIRRNKKLLQCSEEIFDFLKTDFDKKKFSYLKQFKGKTVLDISKSIPKSTYVIYKVK